MLRAPLDGGLAPPAAPREVFTAPNDPALEAVSLSAAPVDPDPRALADYRRSLVTFERVQEAGIGSGTGFATFSVTTAGGSRVSLQ